VAVDVSAELQRLIKLKKGGTLTSGPVVNGILRPEQADCFAVKAQVLYGAELEPASLQANHFQFAKLRAERQALRHCLLTGRQ
jgi:hypothetical protein